MPLTRVSALGDEYTEIRPSNGLIRYVISFVFPTLIAIQASSPPRVASYTSQDFESSDTQGALEALKQ